MSRILFQPDLPVVPVDLGRTDVVCFVGLVRPWAPATAAALKPGTALPAGTRNVWGKLLVSASADGPADDHTAVHRAGTTDAAPLGGVHAGDLLQVLAGESVPIDATVVDPLLLPVVPETRRNWLRDYGWIDGPHARNCDALYDVPVPIDNYAGFRALYDEGLSPDSAGTDYLALAVQTFFAQGGKRCYVVRMGDPVDALTDRAAAIDRLLAPAASPGDQRSWSGIAHLWGLPDVSFLVLPDLPVLHATAIQPIKDVTAPSAGPEQFIRCVPPAVPDPNLPPPAPPRPAPRFTLDDYQAWAKSLRAVLARLDTGALREVQCVAAMPLAFDNPLSPSLEAPPSALSAGGVREAMARVLPEITADNGGSLSSAFLQLAYPWLRTTRSARVLEGLEPPDGALAGVLARNALLRGTFTSATKIPPADIVDLFPSLPTYETLVPAEKPIWNQNIAKPLVTRFSLFGFTPAGIRLLSDVTTYPGEAYRPAPVNRLVSVVSRMARYFGESHLFASNGPQLWGDLERTLRNVLTRLWGLGAFDGASPAEAFSVRCDRSTMTQNDIDNGRLVAIVSFQAAASIELITVTLTVQAGSATESEILSQFTGAA